MHKNDNFREGPFIMQLQRGRKQIFLEVWWSKTQEIGVSEIVQAG